PRGYVYAPLLLGPGRPGGANAVPLARRANSARRLAPDDVDVVHEEGTAAAAAAGRLSHAPSHAGTIRGRDDLERSPRQVSGFLDVRGNVATVVAAQFPTHPHRLPPALLPPRRWPHGKSILRAYLSGNESGV